ncbi:hypothetical protein ACSBLW_08125 [Thioclava sp. FR2]|uniref:hypothetical protein n=1 Tax=Thioclava sp. FR2 TaxID=3445780 RepID=UPI003EBF7F21
MSTKAKWPWSVLDLPKMPDTEAEIRRAYAKRLKQIDQATDIEGFAALRQAYQSALRMRQDRTNAKERRAAAKAAPAEDVAELAAPLPVVQFHEPVTPMDNPGEQAVEPSAKDDEWAALRQREQEFQALITFLGVPNTRQSLGERICEALASPFVADEDYGPRLRREMARLVSKNTRQDSLGELELSESIDAATIQALDRRYGWLSDHNAFRRDFWGNQTMLNAMATRVYGNSVAPAEIRQPKGRWGRFWEEMGAPSWAVIVCLILLLKLVGAVTAPQP